MSAGYIQPMAIEVFCQNKGFTFKVTAIFLAVALYSSAPVQAQSALPYMPAPNKILNTSPAKNAPILRGIKIYPDDPFKFDFIIDAGDFTDNPVGANGVGPIQNGRTPSAPTNISTQIMRELILPAIETEINQGENFAQLRQIYHSLLLATGFKNNLKQTIVNQVYANQKKISGVDVNDKQIKEKIYRQYVQAFRRGAYNYIKKDIDRRCIPGLQPDCKPGMQRG